MNPSDFLKHPYESVFENMECEIVARNIMVILSRTGNTWRTLSLEEYTAERSKDVGLFNGVSDKELALFAKVQPYCVSSQTAYLFSKNWG